MPGKPWTSQEQFQFLTERIPQYLESQANNELAQAFWPRLYREWFSKFPEPQALSSESEPQTAEMEEAMRKAVDGRRKMLCTWFRWRASNTVRKKSVSLTFSLPKGRGFRQDIQVYSKMFYESKLKAIVAEELEGKQATKGEKFKKLMEVTKREWAKENDAVKEQVRERKEAMEREQESDSQATIDAIDDLGHVVGAFLQHIKRTTGWTGFLVIGGPKPDLGGDLVITSLFSDVGDQQTFQSFHPQYQQDIVTPFGDYLKLVYPSNRAAEQSCDSLTPQSEPVITAMPRPSNTSTSITPEPGNINLLPAPSPTAALLQPLSNVSNIRSTSHFSDNLGPPPATDDPFNLVSSPYPAVNLDPTFDFDLSGFDSFMASMNSDPSVYFSANTSLPDVASTPSGAHSMSLHHDGIPNLFGDIPCYSGTQINSTATNIDAFTSGASQATTSTVLPQSGDHLTEPGNGRRLSGRTIVPTEKGKMIEFVANAANKENDFERKRHGDEGHARGRGGGKRGRGRGRANRGG